MNSRQEGADTGLLEAILADGRPLLSFTGLFLILCGAFALFLAATRDFLPHDVNYLGMTSQDLCALHECRIVHFMIHDRASFGGSLIAVGSLYMWLVEFPLKQRLSWPWWTLLLSGSVGFASFLSYVGYGYLDSWHGLGTLVILPCFVIGLFRCRSVAPAGSLSRLIVPAERIDWRSAYGIGKGCMLATAGGMIFGGLTIMAVGMTSVFVPQDLQFMGVDAARIETINPRLVPLIAHDRAGFGGGLASTGVAALFCVWCGRASRSLWQALCWAGFIGFGSAIGVHFMVGYVDLFHLLPAAAGAILFIVGLALTSKMMLAGQRASTGECRDRPSGTMQPEEIEWKQR